MREKIRSQMFKSHKLSKVISGIIKKWIFHINLMDRKYKVILLGDSYVGKTSILQRLVNNEFMQNHISTIGLSSAAKNFTLGNDKIKLQIWDTVGHERFRTVTSTYYNRTQGIILVYDCTNKESLQNIQKWIQQIKENVDMSQVTVFLVANKIDLEDQREVTNDEGLVFNMPHFECSAQSGEGVENVFRQMAGKIHENHKEEAGFKTSF